MFCATSTCPRQVSRCHPSHDSPAPARCGPGRQQEGCPGHGRPNSTRPAWSSRTWPCAKPRVKRSITPQNSPCATCEPAPAASNWRLTSEAYLDGFSLQRPRHPRQLRVPQSEFRRLSKADALGTLIEKLTSPDINLSPAPVKNTDGSVRQPGLDNHGMGTIFEELVRGASTRRTTRKPVNTGPHATPCRLMAKLVFLPIAEQD